LGLKLFFGFKIGWADNSKGLSLQRSISNTSTPEIKFKTQNAKRSTPQL
jgi:hypothetical protein